MKRLLHEPLLHFFLIGAALFAAYHYLQPARSAVPSSKEIRLSLDDLEQLALIFQSQWKREPTEQELSRLVEERIKEEVLYREALAMGLDKGDTIVKRRMAQKMQFLAEDMAAAREPATDELKVWFARNNDKFAMPGRYSFRHLYFSPDKRGAKAREDAANALTKITDQPVDSKLAASLGDQFMFQDYYGDRTSDSLAKEFGPQFAVAVAKLKPGSWQGPIESGLGWHLVFVDSVVSGRVPTFEEVEGDVKNAWLSEQKAQAWDKAYREMRANYTVLLPSPPTKDTARAPAPQIHASSDGGAR
jgi:parvulin-like peptidyl-prolyl isomerase